MKDLVRSAVLVAATAFLVWFVRGDAQQAEPAPLNTPLTIVCNGGSLDNVLIYAPTTRLGMSYYDMQVGDDRVPGAGGQALLTGCYLTLAEDVGTQGGAVAPSESAGPSIQPGDVVIVGSEGCDLQSAEGVDVPKPISAGTALTVIDARGNAIWKVQVGGEVGFVAIERQALDSGA
jgi:hypothetical protein